MASGPLRDDGNGSFRRIFGGGTVTGMDEGELLRRFATRRDPSALEALVVRHGPMVLGVCRRVLVNRDASEDAFQATFLVLARKAGSIRDPDRLGPWLHGVAHRDALRSRADRARRQARERTGTEEPAMAAASSEPDFDRDELKATLDDEVRRLPQKFRDPIVLCYLDGLTHDEAAVHLACPVGTVRSRLATGREKLRDRLSRRGVTVPSALFAGILTAETASAAISPALLLSTVRASTAFASGMVGATAAGLVPATVASLAEGVSTTMIVSKLKVIGALMMTGILTLGVGGATAQRLAGPAEAENAPKTADDTPEDQVAKLKAQLAVSEARVKLLDLEVMEFKEQLKKAKMTKMDPSMSPVEPQTSKGTSSSVGSTNKSSVGAPGIIGEGMTVGPREVNKGQQEPRAAESKTAEKDSDVRTYQNDQFVIVYKPNSDKVSAHSPQTGEWTSFAVPKEADVRLISIGNLVALTFQGDSINQVATYVAQDGKWYPIDLKEPGKGAISPSLAPNLAVYTVGHHAYGFSLHTKSWDVVELPERAGDKLGVMTTTTPNSATVQQGDFVALFNARTGKWTTPYAKTSPAATPEKK